MHSEFVRMYHPFESYFRSLPDWDGVDYIGQLARTVHVKYDQERFVEYFRKWFVGIVPTIMDEQVVNHEIMVCLEEIDELRKNYRKGGVRPPDNINVIPALCIQAGCPCPYDFCTPSTPFYPFL